MKAILTMLVFLILAAPAYAKHLHHEKYYQDLWCQGKGKTEVVLPDKTRCDCLTATHAVEVDFATRWYEALGQSLYYGLQTGKRLGYSLSLRNPKI